MKVLDIGSGHGFPLLEIADRLGIPGHVTGLDPLEDACQIITAKITHREVKNATIVEGVAEKIPFDNDQFDLITSNNGLNNVNDQCVALKECYRVAKPGAQMVMTMNLPYTMIEFYDFFEEVLREKGLTKEVDQMQVHIASKRKPVEFLKDLIISAGFAIKSIDVDGFKYRFTDAEAMLRHFTIKNYFLPSWKSILPADKADEIIGETANRINNLCRQKGEFTLSIPFVCFDCYK